MKKVLLFAAGTLLFASCGGNDDASSIVITNEITSDMQLMLDAKKGFSKDTVIYLTDGVTFVDKVAQSAEFGKDDKPGLTYKALAMSSAINFSMKVQPGSGELGSIWFSCHPGDSDGITFQEPVFPLDRNGYKLTFMDSLKVGKSVYYDVLKFDVSMAPSSHCSASEYYYGYHDGLLMVVSKNGIEMSRVSEKVYKENVERRLEERAEADSIAQAVADSLAQAVADSIAQAFADSVAQATADSIRMANPSAEEDSTASTGDTTKVEIPQEVLDMADSIADCVKKAYLSGSLSAIKNCGI
ncbi:MAG: hypothetical protein IJM92_00510 [Fibrobacter sp.]|uniref:hypothetical protein n=1 Tax=Fibrobacter sp. TaxID=35828 RepID=UPI0025BA7288|nr:hypothetical protein [Fibrobacter sp.]MBQ3715777.1 hypothetical protein [Fibrobacter sp.]MBQ7078155.1 hypothetical protein [Fibrobacter sp.]